LFIDIIGYSKLLMNEQSEVLQQLNQAVRITGQARQAECCASTLSREGTSRWSLAPK
jgi:hypothetical protein